MKTDMALFEDYQIRRVYDEEAEIWWFSVIDIVQVLTQQVDYKAARNYWKVLKNRLKKKEVSWLQIVTN
jgi:prophage antirepressor-like protein